MRLFGLQIHGARTRRRSESRLMEAHLALENRRPFRCRPNRRARRVLARAVGRLLVPGPVPPVAVIVVVIARNVEEAAAVRMTPPALRESRRSSMPSDRGASRTLARGSPVL